MTGRPFLEIISPVLQEYMAAQITLFQNLMAAVGQGTISHQEISLTMFKF